LYRFDINLPEQIIAGMSVSFPKADSKGVCVLASGIPSIAAQFAIDASSKSKLCVTAALDGIVPGWLVEGTDAVMISSPGNATRTMDTYRTLRNRGCRIHCITSDGLLADMCKNDGNQLILIPSETSPRDATGIEIGIISRLLESIGSPCMRESLETAIPHVKQYRDSILENESLVRKISSRLCGKTVAIYSAINAVAAARRWKFSIGECSSNPSFYGEIPDFDHNEIVGWADPNVHAKDLEMVVLKTNTGIQLLECTMDCMIEVLEESGREVTAVRFDDDGIVAAELKAMVLGDAVSEKMRMAV
jgi:glucose/mannose-6-phosphate isomerase